MEHGEPEAVQQRTLHQSALGPLLHQFEMSGARGPQVPGVSVALNLCHALPSDTRRAENESAADACMGAGTRAL